MCAQNIAESPIGLSKECQDIYDTLKGVEQILIEIGGVDERDPEKCGEEAGIIGSLSGTLCCIQQSVARLSNLANDIRIKLY